MATARCEETLGDYRSAIGRARKDLITPALILDLDQAKRNIQTMAERMAGQRANLRPHAKIHKNPRIAALQIEAGAIGLTVATVWEALIMVRAGIPNVLVANEVVGTEKIRLLAEIARQGDVSVAVDSIANLDELSKVAVTAGSEIGVLVDYDVGMARCGVSTPEEALDLARHAINLPGIRFEGMMGYEGHCMLEPERDVRVTKARSAMDDLIEAVDYLAQHGIACPVVAGGGTGTYDITGANPRLTELQAGSYVFMDAFHGDLVPGFPVALTVLATVISRQGTRVVLDSGRKVVGSELGLPRVDGIPSTTLGIAEEHLILEVEPSSPIRVGDRLEVVPGYGPTTVNLHDVYYVVENGVVTDIWPVLARGAGLGPYV